MSGMKEKLGSTSKMLARAKLNAKVILEIPLENILIDEKQVRTVFDQDSLNGLAQSLINQGQIEPIVVSPKDENGMYRIQKGERRYRAAKIAGFSTIEAIINDPQNLTKTALLMQQLAENIQREDLTPLEISKTLHRLNTEEGMSKKEIAESLGKSQSWVSQHFSIVEAPSCIKELIESGKANDATTVSELIKLHKTDPEKCNSYCEAVKAEGGNVSRVEVKALRANKDDTVDTEAKESDKSSEQLEQKRLHKKKVLATIKGEDGTWEVQISKSTGKDVFVKQELVGKFVDASLVSIKEIV